MELLIQPFIDYLRFEKRYAANTIRSYGDDLERFFEYVSDQFGTVSLGEIGPSFIRSWLASLKDQQLSSRSINRKISTLKSYYKYQLRNGAVEQSPMGVITSPKISKRLPVYVEQKDTGTLFSEVGFPEGWAGRTDRLLLSIFYQTGMRLSELVNLRERQVDTGNRAIKVLGKGNKERIIPAGPALMEEIREYCDKKRTELETPDREYLLVGGGRNYMPNMFTGPCGNTWGR